MTESERKRRGIGAKFALHDEALTEALNDLENDIHAEWAAAWTLRGRERHHADLKALKRLRTKLATIASNAPRD